MFKNELLHLEVEERIELCELLTLVLAIFVFGLKDCAVFALVVVQSGTLRGLVRDKPVEK